MQRLYDFLRRHPTGVDSFWAVLFFGVSMLNVVGEPDIGRPLKFAAVPVVIALSTAVALRRKWTQAMFWLTLGAGVFQLLMGIVAGVYDVSRVRHPASATVR